MPITENLDVFFADFGVSVVHGPITGLGILDMPGELVMDGRVISTAYTLTCRKDQFGALGYKDLVVVDGATFAVQENRQLDASFVVLHLEKAEGDEPVEFVFDGDFE